MARWMGWRPQSGSDFAAVVITITCFVIMLAAIVALGLELL